MSTKLIRRRSDEKRKKKMLPDSAATKVKKLRLLLHLTQTELSRVLAVSLPTIQRWEAGATPVNEQALRTMKAVYSLLAEAQSVIENEHLGTWFHSAIDSFGGLSPLEALYTPRGVERVSQLLGRLEWGIPD